MGKIPNWYVITGGPNSGKTTTIEYLSKLGYHTVPEYARLFIDRELKKGKSLEEIRGDEVKFQDKVARLKIELEKKIPKNEIIFLDRGLPDSIAYYKFLNAKPPKLITKLSKNRYKKVFLLDMLPYKKDYARKESKKDAQKIHAFIKKTYEELGYDIIKVPIMPVEDRVKLILEYIK